MAISLQIRPIGGADCVEPGISGHRIKQAPLGISLMLSFAKGFLCQHKDVCYEGALYMFLFVLISFDTSHPLLPPSLLKLFISSSRPDHLPF